MRQNRQPPPTIRLQPKTGLALGLSTGSQVSVILLGIFATFLALDAAQVIMAPVSLAIVTGLMFSPVALWMERRGLPVWASATVIVLLFLLIIGITMLLFAFPMSLWLDRLPAIWAQLQTQLTNWRHVFESLAGLQQQIRAVTGSSSTMTVDVADGSTVTEIAVIAPTIMAQIILFLASLYFFVATRHAIRISVLSLCFNRRARLRAAHMFRDAEWFVSRYLLSISIVNLGLGLSVGAALWLAGVPSPFLWGMLAFVLNYVIYIGPALVAVILLGVGLATYDTMPLMFMPMSIYLALNLVEAQVVTPQVIGRTLTLNPFFVLLSLTFWIWLWGPAGGFIAVPSMLLLMAVLRNILPSPKS